MDLGTTAVPFSVTIARRGTAAWIYASGDVDYFTAEHLREALEMARAGGARHLVIDSRDITLFGAAATSVLLDAARALERSHGSVTVLKPSDTTRRVLALTGADQIVRVI